MGCACAVVTAAVLVTSCSSSGSTSPALTTHSVGAGLSGVGTLPKPASAWPEAGYDARFSSGTSAVGPQQATVRWHVSLGGDVTPGPVLAADGSVVAASQNGKLFDLDASTGRTIWTFDGGGSYGSDLSTSPAVLANGTILWPGPKNTLFALDSDGHEVWHHAFAGQVLSPAIAGHDRAYVADETGRLVALDVSSTVPKVAWQLKVGGPDYASPSVGPDGTIYTAANQDLVAVRDLGDSGAIRWQLHVNKLIEVSNAVAPNGTVVLGTNSDQQYGVRPDGSIAWSFRLGDNTYSSAVATPKGVAYFGDNAGRLRVVDTKNGDVEHTITPLGTGKERIWSAAAVDSKGDFYWGTTAGNVYGYGPTGKPLFHLDVGSRVDSYPAIGGDGTLYLGTTKGDVYAIG